jgi:hypothetical protein
MPVEFIRDSERIRKRLKTAGYSANKPKVIHSPQVAGGWSDFNVQPYCLGEPVPS